MKTLMDMRIKIFTDSARIEDFKALSEIPYIKGFTTNPTLMRKAGVEHYESWVQQVLDVVPEKPVSLEVIADDFSAMRRQALKLSAFGDNVYVKIPVMNTSGESSVTLVTELTRQGVKVNVTAIMTTKQVAHMAEALEAGSPAIVSCFAGRIADTGRDPVPVMQEAKQILEHLPQVELLWASPRELLNLFQAEAVGVDIITIQPDIIAKFNLIGHDLHSFSRDTVKMFFNDAVSSGFVL